MKRHKGLFITFEGGDGSGKSTLAKSVFQELQKMGIDALFTREPGGTPFAEHVRKLILQDGKEVSAKTELLLVLAARNDHVEKVLLPMLERGGVVLCDRFVDSTVVYQGYAAGHDPYAVEALANQIIPRIPDCTFLLDLPHSLALQRRKKRKELLATDKMEQKEDSFHEAVRDGFLTLARHHPERIVVFDGSEAPATLVQKALDHIRTLL